jgi:hypothetical protein
MKNICDREKSVGQAVSDVSSILPQRHGGTKKKEFNSRVYCADH